MQTIQIPAARPAKACSSSLRTSRTFSRQRATTTRGPCSFTTFGPTQARLRSTPPNSPECLSRVSGGFIEVGVGVYRVDVPNAAIVPGANQAVVIVTDNTVLASSTVFGSVLIELTNIPTDFSGSALRRVAAR